MWILFVAVTMKPESIVKRELIKVIKRFKFEELENAVMPIFPEISWTRVKSKLIKNHKNFTITNAVRIIEEVLESTDLRQKDLHDRLTTLEVTDVSRHDKKKIWYGYELTEPDRVLSYFEKREIQERIKEKFLSINLNMSVKAVIYNNIVFIHIKEEKRKGRHPMPIFFALFSGQKYFFCSKRNISDDLIKVIANSLGYTNSKKIKLSGKDLNSLIKLLWIKQQGALSTEDINEPSVYKPSDPIVSNNGIDYTQNRQRKKYAEQCFGKDPPTLELLIINGPVESIKHDNIASKLPTDSIHMNWEFRSRNITRFLTSLVERRAFTLPLPDYVSNLMTLGKNELTLKTDRHT